MEEETTLLNCHVAWCGGEEGGGERMCPLCMRCGLVHGPADSVSPSIDSALSSWGLHTRHATSCILCCNNTGNALVTSQTARLQISHHPYLRIYTC